MIYPTHTGIPRGDRPLVALDIDGVCADFVRGVQAGRAHHGRQPLVEVHRDLFRDLDAEQKRELEDFIQAPNFCARLELLPGAQDAVFRIGQIADLMVVTTPWWGSPTWVSERRAWVQSCLNIAPDRIVFTSAKWSVPADVFVDDHERHIAEWRARHPHGTAFHWPASGEPTDWEPVIREVERRAAQHAQHLAARSRVRVFQ